MALKPSTQISIELNSDLQPGGGAGYVVLVPDCSAPRPLELNPSRFFLLGVENEIL